MNPIYESRSNSEMGRWPGQKQNAKICEPGKQTKSKTRIPTCEQRLGKVR